MLRFLCFLAASTISIWADDSLPAVLARVKAETPPAGQPTTTYPIPREEWMDHFVANLDKLKQGPYDIIFDGDALIENWQRIGLPVIQQHYGNLKILNLGITGDQVQQVLWRAQHGEVDGQNPKLIMLLVGTNNFGSGQDPKDVAAGIKLILNEYETHCPDAHILLLGLFPRAQAAADSTRTWMKSVNAILSTYSSDPKVIYMDIGDKFLQPDGSLSADTLSDFIYPTAKGYGIWADAIQPVIDKSFPNAATK